MPQLSLVYDREILKRISLSTAYIVVAHDELVRSFSIIFSAAHHFILTSLTRRCSQPLAALRFRRSKALPPTNINPYLERPFGVAELDVRLYKNEFMNTCYRFNFMNVFNLSVDRPHLKVGLFVFPFVFGPSVLISCLYLDQFLGGPFDFILELVTVLGALTIPLLSFLAFWSTMILKDSYELRIVLGIGYSLVATGATYLISIISALFALGGVTASL